MALAESVVAAGPADAQAGRQAGRPARPYAQRHQLLGTRPGRGLSPEPPARPPARPPSAPRAPTLSRLLPTTPGAILTKMDGDSRGGAALSINEVSGKPIKFVGVGEKMESLEPFYPERMAGRWAGGVGGARLLRGMCCASVADLCWARSSLGSLTLPALHAPGCRPMPSPTTHATTRPPSSRRRILGKGDMLTLFEKAQSSIKMEDAQKMQDRMMANKFDFNDFLAQFRQINNMGGLQVGLGGGRSRRGQRPWLLRCATRRPRCAACPNCLQLKSASAHLLLHCPPTHPHPPLSPPPLLQMMKMMPGMAQVSEKQLYQLEKELKRFEAMIGSMTPEVGRPRWCQAAGKQHCAGLWGPPGPPAAAALLPSRHIPTAKPCCVRLGPCVLLLRARSRLPAPAPSPQPPAPQAPNPSTPQPLNPSTRPRSAPTQTCSSSRPRGGGASRRAPAAQRSRWAAAGRKRRAATRRQRRQRRRAQLRLQAGLAVSTGPAAHVWQLQSAGLCTAG
jgi:hypothetical protein